jgi:hypothetical protein
MAAAGKVVKNCSLPLGAKLGATLDTGIASLISYKMVQNNLSPNKTQSDLTLKVDNIKTDISSHYKNKLVSNNSDTGSNDKSFISELDVEQIQLDYYLQIIILYLFILVLIFLIMKYIADKYINSIDNLPLNNNIKKIIKKILN